MEKNEKQRLRRNDAIFIAVLLAVIAVVGVCFYFFRIEGNSVTLRGEGNAVTVSVDGKVIATYPLDEDRVEDIRTGTEGLNRLVIEDGKAWVETASCPDGVCAAHKPIHREGESIVCLPNKVVIAVTTTDGDDAPDVVV